MLLVNNNMVVVIKIFNARLVVGFTRNFMVLLPLDDGIRIEKRSLV